MEHEEKSDENFYYDAVAVIDFDELVRNFKYPNLFLFDNLENLFRSFSANEAKCTSKCGDGYAFNIYFSQNEKQIRYFRTLCNSL